MSLNENYNINLKRVIDLIDETQSEKINSAASIIADSIANGGIIQSFGSGHSFGGALEVAGRAGGYIGSKSISGFSGVHGWLEVVEGVGTQYIKQVDIEENDCFIMISNSGKNPLQIEFAKYIKDKGNKLIVVTNYEDSKNATAMHSSGKKLYEFADVYIDNCGFSGDCSLTLNKYQIEVGPTSSIATAYILNHVILKSYEVLESRDIEPPVYKSANIEGGREYNQVLRQKYARRLNRV